MSEIHDRKNSDYASDDDPYSNFKFAAAYAEIPLYKVYLVIEGIKTARLHQLHKGKTPKNESMDDTYLDKATYAAIEASNLMVDLNSDSLIYCPVKDCTEIATTLFDGKLYCNTHS